MNRQHPQAATPVSEQEFDRNFKPRGAIAFFILLVILALIIWYGIYLIMASCI